MNRFCATCNGWRIGFRSRWIGFVWYPRRGSVEAWLFKFAALRHEGRWVLTRNGQLVIWG